MDRFRLLERIGSGGMGTVYRAFDERLQRHVAVKELSAANMDRVLREAQAAARLNHPSIVTLYEYGTHDDHALLVSELVAGATLGDLAAGGELTDRDVGEIGADLTEALEHAHARGVIHRDVKPDNVVVRDDEDGGQRAKLMDFGIASLVDEPTLTATGEVLGTLAYMSPEQAEGEMATPASDVYSLALTLYECWAGENPVRRSSPAETARAIGEEVPSLGAVRPDLPARLVDMIDGCLDPDADLRPDLDELSLCLTEEMHWLNDSHHLPPVREHHRDPVSWSRLGVASAYVALTPVLGAVSAGGAIPAFAGGLGRTPLARFAFGVLGWCVMLMTALALDIPPHLGIHQQAGETVAATLTHSSSLLGAAIFGIAAILFGVVLSARHIAVALLGALLWAAGLSAALQLVGNGSLGDRPAVLALAALAAVALSFMEFEGVPARITRHPAHPHPARTA
jgi:serine/threonine protein kinase